MMRSIEVSESERLALEGGMAWLVSCSGEWRASPEISTGLW